jgi:hypothetical protein
MEKEKITCTIDDVLRGKAVVKYTTCKWQLNDILKLLGFYNTHRNKIVSGDIFYTSVDSLGITVLKVAKKHEFDKWDTSGLIVVNCRNIVYSKVTVPTIVTQEDMDTIFEKPVRDSKNILLQDMEETFSKCLEVATRKNSDYGGKESNPYQNFSNSEIVGVSIPKGIMVRMMDKVSRISTLLEKEAQVKDEAIEDTLDDLINYTAILKSYLKQHKNGK